MSEFPRENLVQIWAGSARLGISLRGTGFFISQTKILTCKHVVNRDDFDIAFFEAAEVVEIRPTNGDKPIKVVNIRPTPGLDLAILELEEPRSCHVVPLLFGLSENDDFYNKWLTSSWITVGFPAMNRGKNTERNSLTKRSDVPVDCTGEQRYPRRVEFENGVLEGCSGSPIWIFINGQWICTGLMTKGGEGKTISSGYTTDLTIRSLRELGIDLSDIKTIEPSVAFSTVVGQATQPVNNPTTQATQSTLRSRLNRHEYILAGTALVLFIMAFLAVGIYKKRTHVTVDDNGDTIVFFRLNSSNAKPLDPDPTILIRKKLEAYIDVQNKSLPIKKKMRLIPLDESGGANCEALERAEKYQPRLVVWGNYLSTGHQLSVYTYVWSSVLNKTWKSEPDNPTSLDALLGSSLESLMGKKLIALLHLEIGFFANRNHQNKEAENQFRLYENFDKRISDKESMFQQAKPDNHIRLVVTGVYRLAGNSQANKLIDSGSESCPPDDNNCKAQYDNERGCLLLSKGEVIAGQQLIADAQKKAIESGDLVRAEALYCNMAEALEKSNSNEEAIIQWRRCEAGLRPFLARDEVAQTGHRHAVFALGRLLHHSCNSKFREEARYYLESILPQEAKDREYAEARYLLAHMDAQDSLINRINNIRLALLFLPEDAKIEKRAPFLSLKGELDYRNGNYYSAANAKSEAAQLFMAMGHNPVTLHKCKEREARCDFLVYLDSLLHTRSQEGLRNAESMILRHSPCNGIVACLNQSVMKKILLECGYGNENSYIQPTNSKMDSFSYVDNSVDQ